MRPLHSVNQVQIYPLLPHALRHHGDKPHPPPSCPLKSHLSQLPAQTSKAHNSIPCPHQPKKQPSENSVEATTALHTASTTVFEDIIMTVTGGTNDTTNSSNYTHSKSLLTYYHYLCISNHHTVSLLIPLPPNKRPLLLKVTQLLP